MTLTSGDASLVTALSVCGGRILAGTPAYLASEVAQGDDGDFRSDVFSLGSTLYTALEGAPPFGLSDNPIALLQRVAAGEITPPRQSGPLTPLLLRLLARDPAHRPPMAEVRERLATLAASLAVSPGDTLAASLAVSPGDLSAPTLPLPHADPSFTPVDNAQQTLSASSTPEQPTSPAERGRVDALAAGPPTRGEDAVAGLSGPQQLLVGALTVVLLTASVLATMLVGHDTATNNPATLANTSQVAASFPGVAQYPGPSDPAPAIAPPTPQDLRRTPSGESPPIGFRILPDLISSGLLTEDGLGTIDMPIADTSQAQCTMDSHGVHSPRVDPPEVTSIFLDSEEHRRNRAVDSHKERPPADAFYLKGALRPE